MFTGLKKLYKENTHALSILIDTSAPIMVAIVGWFAAGKEREKNLAIMGFATVVYSLILTLGVNMRNHAMNHSIALQIKPEKMYEHLNSREKRKKNLTLNPSLRKTFLKRQKSINRNYKYLPHIRSMVVALMLTDLGLQPFLSEHNLYLLRRAAASIATTILIAVYFLEHQKHHKLEGLLNEIYHTMGINVWIKQTRESQSISTLFEQDKQATHSRSPRNPKASPKSYSSNGESRLRIHTQEIIFIADSDPDSPNSNSEMRYVV